MTDTMYDPIELLREELERRFQQHTDRLTELLVLGARAGGGHHLDARIAATRREIADSAHALRRMADGTYGVCGRCGSRLPMPQLRTRPQAWLCTECELAA